MAQELFKTELDINEDWLIYIENEAESLKQEEDYKIENYMDREFLNPEMQLYLADEKTKGLLSDIEDKEDLSLGLKEGAKTKQFSGNLPIFKKLKKKIKKEFCKVVRELDDIEPKDILKATLLALIPALGGGVGAALLPLIIGILASLLKHGIDKVCPA